ncbi:uncharacterized protein EpC_pEp0260020 (plasmid) [Erwinia pyrifoliae Ep1/96]|nr:uncharacterized protein EpC_pEp0260020 [Erwinia pyrifoliae Ep1/96]
MRTVNVREINYFLLYILYENIDVISITAEKNNLPIIYPASSFVISFLDSKLYINSIFSKIDSAPRMAVIINTKKEATFISSDSFSICPTTYRR